ncbi:MAG TPA: universal stress protein [Burkholderiaceae bacterium]|jgi:nucleotide-binding universal stress UspA family protein|nr:universal stress protein [Burkholderiaceae bacterium]
MFKSILIPTDGSSLSDKAVYQGLQMARALGSKAVAVHVTVPFHVLSVTPAALTTTREQREQNAAAFNKEIFERVAANARELGVDCTCVSRTGEHVWQEIIMAAEANGCDAICMASHGRRGLAAMMLGSETMKVLTHTKIPVVVLR